MLLYSHYLAASGHVSTDSRQPQPGTLFFALNGPSFRGAAFAPQALEKGACHAVVDDAELAATDPSRYTYAPDPLVALQELARHHRQQFDIPVLAITGSNGKTTTKELLTAVLAQKFQVLATIGNLNNHIGVPLTLLRLRSGEHNFAVIEMGANHRGEIAELCELALPTYGLITNIGKAHLEGFGGAEGVALGKGELFDYLARTGGTAFVNTLDARLPSLAAAVPTRLTYPGPADTYPATLLSADPAVALRLADGTDIAAQLTGDYNFPNLAAAAAVGLHFGIAPEKVATALAHYNPQNNRSQLLRTAAGNDLILDAYNANPSSMAAALRSFAARPAAAGQTKLAVLGDMFELGDDSAAEHRQLGQLLAELNLPAVLLIGPEMSAAATVAAQTQHFANKADAAEWLKQHPVRGQQVLVKGSRGMALETLVELL
ncbi:UDP-N-acetylmuramoyl-tripeptide--D-alanyl-D-alanine ligase [Hymenobacter sp. BT770]|uniref:UDP-N-acetylmuramoyl-tripeptide--D-alanyl-D- alanine ligase n=1 Tax=Hymenobacter sp. BT770 TaxID=2886942 RepID=UPI001D12D048|nr:UDP-N-acetylmuramoyl-tripeptide--D-alanyl-D-alanine ligase [Hymenobacter sp. BT770]MCC3153267.1 UDP-N-acetylmuramoyl-tripeptide--D-alanyl-D-alanine ligase [Hymenobacter sp. BT770]MDO3414262.1 UDP-N-acetylmuramoyl-tripeptide--D-alanyl-D-alanine ligase [Hymenobacter sp. BT770]